MLVSFSGGGYCDNVMRILCIMWSVLCKCNEAHNEV